MILTMAFIVVLPNFIWAQSGSTETSGHPKGASEKSHMIDHAKMKDTVATKAKSVTEPVDHSKMDHSKMDHSKMDHSKMDHSKMDHSKMDRSKMDRSKMDHSKKNDTESRKPRA